MKQAYEEVKRALVSEKHRYLSEDTLQLCLEALKEHEDKKHNGYANYSTWLVANYIANHEETYKFYSDLKQDLIRSGEPAEVAIGVIAQSLQNHFATEAMKIQEYCNKVFGNANFWSSIINDIQQAEIKYWQVAKAFYED